MDFVAEGLSKRLEQEKANKVTGKLSERHNMPHCLINAKDVETGKPTYNFVDLNKEAHMLTPAGSDTTSAVMAALFFYLIHHTAVFDKLKKEVGTKFTSLDEIRPGKGLASCLYLYACIGEALRMNPHGGSESRREVLPGGLRIKDEIIPAGTIIGGAVFAVHHKPEIYPDTFRFRPERWIMGNGVTNDGVTACEGAAFTFDYGVHACPGENLARMQ